LYVIPPNPVAPTPSFKVMVFFTTARVTQVMAELFQGMGTRGPQVWSVGTPIQNPLKTPKIAFLNPHF